MASSISTNRIFEYFALGNRPRSKSGNASDPTLPNAKSNALPLLPSSPLVLEKGTKCLLCDLLFSSTMNGALCKVVGSYREVEGRYPVYVYKTKETALIKTANLKSVRTKTIKRRMSKQSTASLPYRITRFVFHLIAYTLNTIDFTVSITVSITRSITVFLTLCSPQRVGTRSRGHSFCGNAIYAE